MTATTTARPTVDWEEVARQRAARVAALSCEVEALRARVDGDPEREASWLQRKVAVQAAALDRLNRRVLSQRLALRTVDELGRGLTRDEWVAAREGTAHQSRVLATLDVT